MIGRNRKYVSGTGWCLWRFTDVDSEYIVRLHVLKTPWFALCLHWLLKPDPEPFLHDHPVTFLSVILRGGYSEIRSRSKGRSGLLHHRFFNWIRATPEDCHSICDVKPKTLTLCLMGPKTREWGFHTGPDPKDWIYWKDYYTKQREEKAAGVVRFKPGSISHTDGI